MPFLCTRMPSVFYSCVFVCHAYVTRIYSCVIRMSRVCTRMSSVCHSHVLVCHPYVTRLWFYHEPFNPDINKRATQVCFSQRSKKSLSPPIFFISNNLLTYPCQKHLRLVLDRKLSFNDHITQKINKCNKLIGFMKKLSLIPIKETIACNMQNIYKVSTVLSRTIHT